ncbi:hypothetical protein [Microbacterium sp. 3J1]|uniref:hypothetical protein n=1 Tax=Microbacterium sp. 3J1 TaxID=861269 RepID=UPI000A4D1E6F|nr:hypothetical protein [Microbacterium sp. 3J1]
MSVGGILTEIGRERGAQDAKWGAPKNVPNGTGLDGSLLGYSFGELRDMLQSTVDRLAERRESTMAAVLLEEVFEVLAEDDDERVREELIQVAAVAAKWVQIIDERKQAGAA